MVESEAKSYDYICIGAGSGSMGSGRRAALLGKKVLMIENRVIGGTCVNVGCVPKKVMFNLANFLEEAQVIKEYGVRGTEGLKLDFAHFKARRDFYVKRLNNIYDSNLANSGIDYLKGTASFESDSVVVVQGENGPERYTSEHILIASGSAPEPGVFEGSDLCWSSDDFFTMEQLPERMVVIGGGYIGVELAQILHALGVKVTLVVRSIILRFLDRDVVDILLGNMRHSGLDVRLDSPHKRVFKNDDNSLSLELNNGEIITAEHVLVALGRPPNVAPLNLQNTSVELVKGAVKVDEFQNTTAPGIYAIGDVTNQATLTPVAIRAGRILSERIFGGRTGLKMSYANIATVIFSHPVIGTVGLSEEAAKKQHGEENVAVYKSNFVNMFFSPMEKQEDKQKSMIKVVCLKTGPGNGKDASHEKVIGAVGIGKAVDEMMQGVSIAITMGATKQDFDNSVAIHPTGSEEFVLLDPKFSDLE